MRVNLIALVVLLCIGQDLYVYGEIPEPELRYIVDKTFAAGTARGIVDEADGWHDPSNETALLKYVSCHTNKENNNFAIVLLDLVQNNRPGFNDPVKAGKRVLCLRTVLSESTNVMVLKMANIALLGDLLTSRDIVEQRKQTDKIIQNINWYKTERNKYFVRYLEILDEKALTLEPTVMELLVIGECHSGELKKALAIEESIKTKFPNYDRSSIQSHIELLKSGINPYPL